MEENWEVETYESQSGEKPVDKFIKSLDANTQQKFLRMLDYLAEFGLEGVYQHTKKLKDTSIRELRILGATSIRIFYVTLSGKIFLLLHGFKKKSQKTPLREIATAQKRLEEYLSRKNAS